MTDVKKSMTKLLQRQDVSPRQRTSPTPPSSPEREEVPARSGRRPMVPALYVAGALFLVVLASAWVLLSPPPAAVLALSDCADLPDGESLPAGDMVTASLTDSPGDATTQESLGAGWKQADRSRDIEHIVQEGESLSEIAYLYGADPEKLAWYNKIRDPHRIRVGQKILVPSLDHEGTATPPAHAAARMTPARTPAARVAKIRIPIHAGTESDGDGVTAHFTTELPEGVQAESWEWDLGNGRKSFRQEAFWTFDKPGTYTVRLSVRGSDGMIYQADPWYYDLPDPSTLPQDRPRFLTLGSVGESFVVQGRIASVNGLGTDSDLPVAVVAEDDDTQTLQALEAGYFNIRVDHQGQQDNLYLYVSPVPSVQVDSRDLNWYRTQFNTGTLSNCGPSSVSMAIAWARNAYVPVSTIRQEVGWKGDGGTGFGELGAVLDRNGVDHSLKTVRKAQDLRDILDRDHIAIVLIHTSKITRSTGSPARTPYGRYYSDSVGHYIVVKGYSLDGNWFVVNDPVPSDWGANSFRQADGISMMGRNRYYRATDILRGLRTDQVIEISK